MPVFDFDGQSYDVKDEFLDDFIREYPDAVSLQERRGQEYRVKASDYRSFTDEFDGHKEQEKDQTPQFNGFGDNPLGISKPVTEPVPAAGWKAPMEFQENIEDDGEMLSEEEKRKLTSQNASLLGKTQRTMEAYNQGVKDSTDYMNSPEAITKQVADGGVKFNEDTSTFDKTYLTPIGSHTTSKAEAEETARLFRNVSPTAGNRMRKAAERLEDVERRLAERGEELYRQHEESKPKGLIGTLMDAGKAMSGTVAGAAMMPENPEDWSEFQFDDEYQALRLQARKLKEEMVQLGNLQENERKGEHFWHDFFRNTWQKIDNVDAWDFGQGAMRDVATMLNISRKDKDSMSDAEKDAMYELYLHQNVMSDAADLGRGARWGDITGGSLSFMKDFLLTGGGFSGLSTKLPEKIGVKIATRAATGLAEDAAHSVGLKLAKEGIKSAILKGGKGAVKRLVAEQGVGGAAGLLATRALGVTAEELLIKAPLMATTIQGQTLASEIIDTRLGKVAYNPETGELRFAEDKTWGRAAWEKTADRVIENFSEMRGKHMPDLTDATKAFGLRGFTTFLLRNTREGAGTALSKMTNFMRAAGYNGILEEIFEEYDGQAWRTMLRLPDAYTETGRYLMDGTPERINNFMVGQFHGDIWGGMALSVGLTGSATLTATTVGRGLAMAPGAVRYLWFRQGMERASARAAEQFEPTEWEAMRSVIDATRNWNIPDLAESVMSDKDLSDGQREAVMDYMERVLNMRGYNLGELLSRRSGETRSAESDEADWSFTEGYGISTPQERRDASAHLLYRHQKAEEAGISNEVILAIDNDPAGAVETVRENRMGWTPEQQRAALDYIYASQVYNGMMQRVRDDIDTQVAASDAAIDNRTNRGTGTVQGATMTDGRQVYVISGNVAATEDGGAVNAAASDESVIVRDPVTGRMEQVSPRDIASLNTPMDPQQMKETAANAIRRQVAGQVAREIDGTLDFVPGQQLQFTDDNGEAHTYAVVSYDGGEYVRVTEDGKKETDLPVSIFQQQADDEAMQRVADFDAQNDEARAVAETEAEEAETEQRTAEYNDGDEITLLDSDGSRLEGQIVMRNEDGTYLVIHEKDAEGNDRSTLTEDELNTRVVGHNGAEVASDVETAQEIEAQTGQTAEITPQSPTALEQIPADDNGQPDYVNAPSADVAWDALVEQSEGDTEIAKAVADGMVAQARKALKAAEKAPMKNATTPAEMIAAQKAKKANVLAAQNAVRMWEDIASTTDRRMKAAEEAFSKVDESRKNNGSEGAPGAIAETKNNATEDVIESVRNNGYDVSEEKDMFGHPFIKAKNGTISFGNIGSETGLTEAPIRLSMGENRVGEDNKNHGYGLLHIEAGHGQQIRDNGFNSVEEFVETVASSYTDIREGGVIADNQTYLLELSDDKNNTLFIQLSRDGKYWNVNSAGIFKKKYSRNKPVVHTVPAVSSDTNTDAEGVNRGQSEGVTATSRNSPRTTGNKDSDSQRESNTQEGKVEENPTISSPIGQTSTTDEIKEQREATDTNPTEEQKKAGNYAKGHIKVDGHDITIENPKGSTRSGKDANGRAWSVKMNYDYGYIRRTKTVDGDHIDVYLSDNPASGNVYVVDQVNQRDGSFDEHKVMYGFPSLETAREAYASQYEKGWKIGTITEVSREEFKKWIDSSFRKTKPFAEYKSMRDLDRELDEAVNNDRQRRIKENQKTFADRYGEQGPVEETPYKPGKYNQQSYASTEENQKPISGTYHDKEGIAVTTDGHILVADRTTYDRKQKGKMVGKNGDEIEAKFPDWRTVVPSTDNTNKGGVLAIAERLGGIKSRMDAAYDKYKKDGGAYSRRRWEESGEDYRTAFPTVAVRFSNGVVMLFKYATLKKFIDAALHLGINDISNGQTDNRAIKAEGKNGLVLAMPVLRPMSERSDGDTFIDLMESEPARHRATEHEGILDQAARIDGEQQRKRVEDAVMPFASDRLKFVVYGNRDELPYAQRAMIESGRRVWAWVQGSTVHIYAPSFRGVFGQKELQKTILHEVVQHIGMERLLGEEFDPMMRQIWHENMTPEQRGESARYVWKNNWDTPAGRRRRAAALPGREDASWIELTYKEKMHVLMNEDMQSEAADEWLASRIEEEGVHEKAWFNKLADAVRVILRKMGVDISLSNSEIADMWRRSAELLKREHDAAAEDEENVSEDADGQTRFRFIGEKGAANLDAAEEATTRLDNLDVARKMEKANKDAKAIKYATGWERGADKKWRYEVPDGKINTEKPFKTNQTLDKVLSDDELFKAYPQLKKSMVFIEDTKDFSAGYFDPITKAIVLNKMYFRSGDFQFAPGMYDFGYKLADEADELLVFDTLVHEIQHVIQGIEGFAKGGNVKLGERISRQNDPLTDYQKNFVEDVQAYLDFEKNGYKGYTLPQFIQSMIRDDESRYGDNARDYILMTDEELRKEFESLNGKKKPLGAYETYQRFAGEVEARNVSRRVGMTAEERRNSLASETEDVAREDQIFLDNLFRTAVDEDGQPSIDTDTRFRADRQVERKGNLIAIHNINAESLGKALDLGGFPMPSIAITTPEIGHTEFGDISLLFGSDTINPSDRRNRVYTADAWTPTFPNIVPKINEKAREKISEKVYSLLRESGYANVYGLYLDESNMDDAIRRWGNFVDAYNDNTAMRIAFLNDKGIAFRPVMVDKKFGKYDSSVYERILKEIGNGDARYLASLNHDETMALESEVRDILRDHDKPSLDSYLERRQKEGKEPIKAIVNFFSHSEQLDFKDVDRIIKDTYLYAQNAGRKEFDKYATEKRIKNKFTQKLQGEFEQWLDNLGEGIIEKYGIRNDTDVYTYSGNRRSWNALHDDITLDNVIKAMLRQDEKGGSGFLGGSPFNAAQTKIGSMSDIRDFAKDHLATIDREAYEDAKGAIVDRLSAIAIPGIDNTTFSGAVDTKEIIVDAMARSTTAKGIYSYIHKWHKGMTMEIAEEIAKAGEDIRAMQTDYLEAKPARAVGFDEVRLAVVPKGTDAELVQRLEDKGIPVRTYNAKKEGDRAKVLNKGIDEENLRFRADTKKSASDTVSPSESAEIEEANPRFRIRETEPPTKTGKGYKVFVLKNGNLYPPMVANPDGEATPVGVWLDADAAPIAGESKTGRPQVKAGGKGTQGGSGRLAYRPGWHLGEIPYAKQFNRLNPETGERELFPADFVWAEVEYAADNDYQKEAEKEGTNGNGKYVHSLAGLKRVPENGYYMYRTNPDPTTDPWIITGSMKVNRILTPAEVDEMVKAAGREPQARQAGALTDKDIESLNSNIRFRQTYHGSGNKFEQFDHSHMGEGEGAQAFGWGTYVTEVEGIGRAYAKSSAKDVFKSRELQDAEHKRLMLTNRQIELPKDMADMADRINSLEKSINDKIKEREDVKAKYGEDSVEYRNWQFIGEDIIADDQRDLAYARQRMTEMAEDLDALPNKIKEVQAKVDELMVDYNEARKNRHLYTVEVPDDNGSNYIEWDKVYSIGEAKKVLQAAEKILDFDLEIDDVLYSGEKLKGRDIYKYIANHCVLLDDNGNPENDGQQEASETLYKAGFVGISYPAQYTTGGRADGARNYVIFNEGDTKITSYERFRTSNLTPEEQAQVDAFEKEVADITKKAKADGTFLKAPNGKDSKLSERNWAVVRTSQFKKWFGDWENDPGNASKVVDMETGEPLLVHHGSRAGGFTVFDDTEGKMTAAPDGASFFSSDYGVARSYSGTYDDVKVRDIKDVDEDDEEYYDKGDPANYEVFLNIREPYEEDFHGANWDGSFYGGFGIQDADMEMHYFSTEEEMEDYIRDNNLDEEGDYEIYRDPDLGMDTNSVAREAMDMGADGAIIYNVYDDGGRGGADVANDYVTFSPEQIKSVDNYGLWGRKEEDIRFRSDIHSKLSDEEYVERLGMIGNLNPTDLSEATPMDKKEAEAFFESLKPGENIHDGRRATWPKNTVGKILRHQGFDSSLLISKIKEVYDNAVPIMDEPEIEKEGHKKHPNFVGYHHYVGKVSLNGKKYLVRLTTQELNTRKKDFIPNQLHSTFVSDVEIVNANESITSGNNPAIADDGIKSDAKLLTFFENARAAKGRIDSKKENLAEGHERFRVTSRFQDGLDSNDEIYDALTENAEWTNGPADVIASLEDFFGGELISASNGARHAIGEGKVPYGTTRRSAVNDGEYHHMEFRGKDGETFVREVPFFAKDELPESVRFRTDVSPSMEEAITIGMIKLADKHKDNLSLRESAVNAVSGSLRRAMNAQRRYDRSTVSDLVALSREMMQGGFLTDLNQVELARVLAAIKDGTGRDDLQAAADRILDVAVDSNLKTAMKGLEKLLKIRGSKVDAKGVEVQGRLDVSGQRMMEAFKKGITLTEDQLTERYNDALDRMSSDSSTVAEEARDEFAGLAFAMRYADNIRALEVEEDELRKDIKNTEKEHMDGTLSLSAEEYRQWKKSQKDAIRENRIDRAEQIQRLVTGLAQRLQGSIDAAKDFTEREKQRVEDIQHDANSDMFGRPSDEHHQESRWDKVLNSGIVRFFLRPLATFDQMLRQFGSSSVDGRGYLWNRFMGGYQKAADAEWNGMQEANAILDRKVSEVFGKGMRWSRLYAIERRLPTAEVTFLDGGVKKPHTLTQGNMLYIYMADKMADGRMKLRKMGISEEDVKAIKATLDPRFIELADWVQGEFLPSLRDKYNEVHKRMFGASMAAIDNYFPLRVLNNARVENIDVSQGVREPDKGSTVTGSVIKRRRNALALDILGADAFSVVVEHVQEMEHWAAFAEFNRDLNTLLSYKRFRNQVKNMTTVYGAGDTLWKNFNDTAMVVAGTYRGTGGSHENADALFLNLAKGVTEAKIAFRFYTALKQTLSFPALMVDANPVNLAKSMATPGESWKWAMENLPLFRKRWESRMAGNEKLMQTDMDWKFWQNEVVKALGRAGMSPNAFVDAVTISIGAKAIYDTKYARYIREGFSEEKADEKARQDASVIYNESQQSSEAAFLSPMQKDRSVFNTGLTVFRNSSMGYQRQLVDAVRNLSRIAFKDGYRDASMAFMTKQLVREGLSEEQAADAAESRYNRQITHDLARVAMFRWIAQFAWNLGSYLPYLLFGGDDDERKEMLDDAAMHALFGSIEGLSAGAQLSELGNNLVQHKKIGDFSFGELPITSDIQTTISHFGQNAWLGINDLVRIGVQAGVGVNPQTVTDWVVSVIDLSNGNMSTAREIGMFVLRVMSVPQSQLDKLYLDELEMPSKEELESLPVEERAKELAERYARYKFFRDSPLTYWFAPEDEKENVLGKKEKRFNTLSKERREKAEARQVTADFRGYWKEYYEVESRRRELAKKAEESGAMEYARQITELLDGYGYGRYAVMKKADDNLTDMLHDSFQTQSDRKRARLEGDALKVAKKAVEKMKAIDAANGHE